MYKKIKKYYKKIRSFGKKLKYNYIYDRYKNYTMVPKEVFISNLQIAEQVLHVDGCIVECGVWKGGMVAGIADILGPLRNYYLFDSFQGLPDATNVDGEAAISWQNNKNSESYYNNCSASKQWAIEAMNITGEKKVNLVEGWFTETLPHFKNDEKIALLRLDGDWYESTMTCLDNLFDRVANNGIIIIDDYYTWDGCSRAVHDFLSKKTSSHRISTFHNVCTIKITDNF